MSRIELKEAAKAQIKGKIGILFVCYLIIFGISIAAGFVPIVGGIVSLVLSPALGLGLCRIYLELTKGSGVEVSTLFSAFPSLGKALWLNILIGVFTFLWSLLFCIPGIIKALSYSMANYILAENPEMTAREALRESKIIMHGHKWEYFVIGLSFLPWNFLAAFFIGIPYVYVVPYMNATTANFYQSIKRQPQVEETPVEENVISEEDMI